MTERDPNKYLDAYRASEDPSPERLAKVLRNIETEVQPLPPTGGGGTAAGSGGWLAKATLGVAVAGVLAVALAGPGAREDSPVPSARPAPPPSSTEIELPPARARTPTDEPGDERAPEPRNEPTVGTEAAHTGGPRPARSTRPAPAVQARVDPPEEEQAEAPDLARDVGLIKEIRTAIVRGQHGAALEKIEEHRRMFPASVLANERTVLEAEALCGSGQPERGRALAATFLKAHTGSPLASRARAACAGD